MSESERPNAERLRDEARTEASRAEAEKKSSLRNREYGRDGYDPEPHRRFSWHHLKWILRGIVLLAILIAVLFLLP